MNANSTNSPSFSFSYFPAIIEEGSPAVEAVKRICQSALFVVLRQEMDRFNNLLHVIHKSLRHLLLGVKGEVVMSQNLEEAYNAMLKQRVPLQWKVSTFFVHGTYRVPTAQGKQGK